jgi:hypothetical protein
MFDEVAGDFPRGFFLGEFFECLDDSLVVLGVVPLFVWMLAVPSCGADDCAF